MVANELDHPALAAGRGGGVDRVHQPLEIRVELLEPLGVQVVPPDRLDRVDVNTQLLELVLRLGGIGIKAIFPLGVGKVLR